LALTVLGVTTTNLNLDKRAEYVTNIAHSSIRDRTGIFITIWRDGGILVVWRWRMAGSRGL
jgi:hypothetical protein